jgi:hypothetical protein
MCDRIPNLMLGTRPPYTPTIPSRATTRIAINLRGVVSCFMSIKIAQGKQNKCTTETNHMAVNSLAQEPLQKYKENRWFTPKDRML